MAGWAEDVSGGGRMCLQCTIGLDGSQRCCSCGCFVCGETTARLIPAAEARGGGKPAAAEEEDEEEPLLECQGCHAVFMHPSCCAGLRRRPSRSGSAPVTMASSSDNIACPLCCDTAAADDAGDDHAAAVAGAGSSNQGQQQEGDAVPSAPAPAAAAAAEPPTITFALADPFAAFFAHDPRQPAPAYHQRCFRLANDLMLPHAPSPATSSTGGSGGMIDAAAAAASAQEEVVERVRSSGWADPLRFAECLRRHGLALDHGEGSSSNSGGAANGAVGSVGNGSSGGGGGLRLVGWSAPAPCDESAPSIVAELRNIFAAYRRQANTATAAAKKAKRSTKKKGTAAAAAAATPPAAPPASVSIFERRDNDAEATGVVGDGGGPAAAAEIGPAASVVGSMMTSFAARRAARIAANKQRLAAL